MKSALFLMFASLAVGSISAIDWDAINGFPKSILRPGPPKRPASPARPLAPVKEEFYPDTHDLTVSVNLIGDNKAPPIIEPHESRPFEPRPPQPPQPIFEEPMGPPVPMVPPMGPPELMGPPMAPPEPHQPKPEPNHGKPKPHHGKPKPPHQFEVQVNEPINKLPYEPISIDVKPLDVVDGFVVPTPKYPAHARPQIQKLYEV